MRILTYYIAKTIMRMIIGVMVVMLSVVFFIKLISEFSHISTSHFSLWQAVAHVLLLLPKYQYQLLPMVCLTGSILGLGVLASHHELVVMRASGMSLGQIARGVLEGAFVLIVCSVMLGEIVSPEAEKYAAELKTLSMTGGHAIPDSGRGLWVKDDNVFMYASRVLGSHELRGVTRYHFDTEQHLKRVDHAKRALFTQDGWVLYDVEATVFKEGQVENDHQEQVKWQAKLRPKVLVTSQSKVDAQSLVQLYLGIKYGQDHGLNTRLLRYIFWKRLTLPLASLIMIFLGLPFMFGPLRSKTTGFRMLVGVVVGFAFYILNESLGSLSLVHAMPPLLAATLPLMLFTMIGLWVMRRVR